MSLTVANDLNLFQENCAYATIGGSCFGKTHIELYMKLERNTYKLGEKIPVHVEATVKGGSSDVDKVIIWTMSLTTIDNS